ncbi:MAG: hypothetical protein ACO1QB_00070, partial [Verrucomicrobiales bacterium]
ANTPIITVDPLASVLNAAPGRSSRLAVNASVFNGEAANITYQWNRNGVAIDGATSSAYTTPVLGAADEGAKYSVTVGYAGAVSVTSDESVVTWDYNYARGGTVTSNDNLWVGVPTWNFGMLVDGDKFNAVHGDTAIETGFAYEVNLGDEVELEEVRIFPRQDGCCAGRLMNFRVTIHNDDNGSIGDVVWTADMFTDGSTAESGPGAVVTITEDFDSAGVFKGQWIRIQSLEDPVQDYALQMTEIEAIGRIEISEPLRLQISRNGNSASIIWTEGSLETSTTLLPGSWSAVDTASPYSPPAEDGARFYRLKK